ncbi:hypothetical protein CAC42_724 [Sphaceloma murrayae]|uniref:NAD(P)-binding domain-containing protein n=1 Tax=Sphaceloma murrayae TaxID=2082308 RepID=A0A2K1QJY1_9PEZI|nr:hypothetical protein CAC42_724 [Sphaceloma murrayae]
MAATHRVLLLGGHGKVALKLTPLLLKRSWDVTSVIRNPEHEAEIMSLGKGHPGKLSVLVESLDEVRSEADASKVLDKANPSIVVWSAGAGGKGGASRTYAIDQDAAKAYITSSLSRPAIKKFLMVSYIASRRSSPPWWNDEDLAAANKVNTEILPDYFKAKVEADEHLLAETERRRRNGDATFQMINLRPGSLTDGEATGKVRLGKTPARGDVTRADVAIVADELLARDDTRGYYDLLGGDEAVVDAIEKLVKEGHDGVQGENMEKIFQRIA